MRRAAFVALLITSLPLYLRAQKGAVGGAHAGIGPPHHGYVQGAGHARHHRNGYGWGAFPYFFPDYETGWPEEVPRTTEEAPLVRVRDESHLPQPAPPLPAQVIEIPNTAASAQRKPLPATVFVLTTGERFETQRYLLTANSISLTVQRDQKTIPLQMVDLDATIAANRDRGVNLRIPNDRNEISVRF